MTYDIAPHQGFGDPDNPDWFSPFHVHVEDDGNYPEWDQELLESTRQFAGSSSYVTQITGFGPARLTLSVWFDTRRDFARFRTRYGTVATLSLLAGLSNHEGIVRTHNGKAYEQFRDTLLLEIRDVSANIDGSVECRVTFQRAYDPRVAP